MKPADQVELENVIEDIRQALCAGDKPLSEFPLLIREMREALIRIGDMNKDIKKVVPVPGVSGAHTILTEPSEYATLARDALSGTTALNKAAMRKECVRLMQWAFTEIRFLCGYGTGLTGGEEAWIRALAEFAHNLPHLLEYDFSLPYFFVQIDELKNLMSLYSRHYKEIINRRAEGWTKDRIYSSLFPQSLISSSLCPIGQSTGNDDA